MLKQLFAPAPPEPTTLNGVASTELGGEYDMLMTVDEWIAVPDNPIQRNTIRRAEMAVRRHLSKASPTHRRTSAAVLPDGSMVKLDGHTRAYLWGNGRLERPRSVTVTVYPVATLDAAEEIYRHFDNQAAVEAARDLRDGAYRKHNIHPTGLLLINGGITSAFSIIEGKNTVNITEEVGRWRGELLAIDSLDASTTMMPSELLAAALLTIRMHGDQAVDFWRLYVAGGGNAVDGQRDGVLELRNLIDVARAQKSIGGTRAARVKTAGRAVSCCESWVNGRRYSVGVKPTDLQDYAVRAKKRPPYSGYES